MPLVDRVGVKLGTDKEVELMVGAMVGGVRDEDRVIESVSEELKPELDGNPLMVAVPTLIEAVLSGIITEVSVLGSGVGSTETVEETVTVAGGGALPALVRSTVLVPVVTITVLVASCKS